MERDAFQELETWAGSAGRRPLILRGARQVGKTWLIQEFGRTHLGQVATRDFERDPRAASLFEDPDPAANLRAVEAYLGRRIQPGSCLLFLDEIQAAPKVLARLRYFQEELPELHVAAAGSLLDFALQQPEFRMPVGRTSYLHLEPFSFSEFLRALGEERLMETLKNWRPESRIPTAVHEKLMGLIREYMIVGGMPACVAGFAASRSWVEVSRLQQDLFATFRDDFGRYATRGTAGRLGRILGAVPGQAGRKFKFTAVDREDRAAPLREALEQLEKARVVHRIRASHGNGIPLAADADERSFKVVLLDTGLLLAALGLRPDRLAGAEDGTLVNEGSLAEHLVGQMLRSLGPGWIEPALFYWKRDRPGSSAELDYLFQYQDRIVPIEVKAGASGALKSLHLFMRAKGLELAIRVHANQAELKEVRAEVGGRGPVRYRLLSIPFYLVGEIERILGSLL
ncbi:MAG: ATP-binding protein [Planctomycetota bacterium]